MDDCLIEAELTPKRKVLRDWTEWSFFCEPGIAAARKGFSCELDPNDPDPLGTAGAMRFPVAHEHTLDALAETFRDNVLTDLVTRIRAGSYGRSKPTSDGTDHDPLAIRKRLIIPTNATKDMFANKPPGLGIGRYYSESIDDGTNEEVVTPPRLVYSFEET
jgi:hypothetical protein